MAVCMILTAVIVALPITVSAATSVSSWSSITNASGDYILTSDITVPAGGTFSGTFSGTIDGNGHTITVADTMFSTVSGATFKNFTINGTVSASSFIGTATGSTVTIENVTSNVNTSSSSNNAAFISEVSGATTLKFTNCINNGSVSSSAQAGAFIGWSGTAFTAVFTGCVNNGTITTTGSHAAGFIGCLQNTNAKFDVTFNACSNKGAIVGDNTSKCEAAGFIAFASGASTTTIKFNDCYSAGSLTNKATNNDAGNEGKYNSSGFVSRVQHGSVTINNSLTNIPASSLSAATGYRANFWYASEGATLTATNCYYFNNGVALSSTESGKGFTAVTAAQLASGEIAYKLNGSTQVDPTWYQLIGTDAVPHHVADEDAIVRYDSASSKYTNDYVYIVAPQFDIALEANYGTYSVYNFNTGANENFTGIKVDVYVNNINSSLTYGIAGIDGYLEFDGAALTPYYTTTEELNGVSGSVNPGPIANFPTYSQTVSGVTFSLFSVEGLCTEYIAGSGSLRMNYIIDVDNHTAWKNSKTGITNADAVKLSYYFTVNSGATDGATYTFKVPANPDATTVEEATLRAPYYTGTTDQTAFGTVFGRAAEAECTITTSTTYTVKFVDYNDSLISSQTVTAGGSATPPANPTRTGYNFTGWQGSYTNVTTDTTVKATYSIQTFTVEFVDHDGTPISTQTVNYGGNATVPADPTRDGYTFTGWSGTYTNVTANSTVTAQYTQNTVAAEFFVFASGADTTYVSIDETNGYLVFKAGGMSASAIAALFNDTNISITKADGTAVTGTALAGTTYIITSTINGESKSLTVVVKGDLNSDGYITSRDSNIVKRHVLGSLLITDPILFAAANVNTDSSITSRDYNALKGFLLSSRTHF